MKRRISFLPTDKIDFVRDVTAYILVVALVVGVAYDGNVREDFTTSPPRYFSLLSLSLSHSQIKLYEAVGFLLFYILYIIVAVVISFVRVRTGSAKLLFAFQHVIGHPTWVFFQ